MKKSIFFAVLVLIATLSPVVTRAVEPWQGPVTKLPGVPLAKVRLTESVLYCYAGYGTQRSLLKIEGQTVQSDTVSNPYLPGFNPLSTNVLRFGCKSGFLFMDFSTLDDIQRFNQNVTYQGKAYNSIKFQYRVLAAGTSISLLPHRLYLDLGLGKALIDYHLGLYGDQYNSQYKSETLNFNNLLLRTSVRFIINHYILIYWQHEKAIDRESVIEYSNQLGLNFMARF
ncbi:MAG: hypothetical protein HQ517_15935 [SAR324 cluster bacterium]|nr:hypothetical protein [SAR324 cluster bacterium]